MFLLSRCLLSNEVLLLALTDWLGFKTAPLLSSLSCSYVLELCFSDFHGHESPKELLTNAD